MAWPTDSWICSAICSAPRISVVSPLGHGGADSSARASSATRAAWAVEVDLVDQLPAPRAVLAAGGRVRAALRLAVADGRGHDPGAALADALVDAVALAGHEPLGGVPDLVQRPRRCRRRARASSPSPARAGRPCRPATRRAGRSRTRWPTTPVTGVDRHAAPTRHGRPGRWRWRSRLARSPAARADGVGEVGDGEEAPSRPDERAHADAGVLVLRRRPRRSPLRAVIDS